ncbi:MAG: ABC transporter substrate-binding protein [Cyanobacteria bacterium J06629_2]
MRDVFRSSLEEKDGEIAVEFNFSQSNFNIVNALAKTKQEEAQVLVFFPNSSGMNALETLDKTFLIAQMNQGELPLLGGDSLYKPRTLQLGQNNVADMVLAVPWNTENTDSGFVELATNLWGGKVNWRSALTYDATMALGAAIQQSATREGIQQALLDPTFIAEGASGEITFLPTGDRAGKVQLVKVKAGESSGFGYDFVPVADFDYDLPEACR